MSSDPPEFLFGVEQECQAFLEDGPIGQPESEVLRSLLAAHARAAPAVQGRVGFFNPYGRVYVDHGHYELASAECASPYDVPAVMEQQEELLARALLELRRGGPRLRLSSNLHAGLLHEGAPSWGAHESYLVPQDPLRFGSAILPFLATRLFAGAGGVRARDARFVASARALVLELDEGGLTTARRALHSTCRGESLAGPGTGRYRYHLICGDGRRSHFATALTLGATALALRGAWHEPRLAERLRRAGYVPVSGPSAHVEMLAALNVLAAPGRTLGVHPLVVRVQRVYLDAAVAWAEAQEAVAPWVEAILRDWERTLTAFEHDELDWLRAHLDPFAKHALFDALLAADGVPWERLAGNSEALARLALLEHDYHALARSDGLPRRLELAGLFDHRVGPAREPGREPEPFVPGLGTRADARARLVVEHAGDPGLVCDWAFLARPAVRRWARLDDPFARSPGPWEGIDARHLAALLGSFPDLRPAAGATPTAAPTTARAHRATRRRGRGAELPFPTEPGGGSGTGG